MPSHGFVFTLVVSLLLLLPVQAAHGAVGQASPLAGTAVLQGTVTDYKPTIMAPLPGIVVQLYEGSSVVATTLTVADGTFSFSVTPGVVYRVQFVGNYTYRGTFYPDALNLERATPITLADGEVKVVNTQLFPKSKFGSVSGVVTDAVTGEPLAGIKAVIYRNGVPYRAVLTAGDGSIPEIALATSTINNTWTVRYWDPTGTYVDQWWNGKPVRPAAQALIMPVTAIDISAGMWRPSDLATISGIVTDAGTGDPLPGVEVKQFATDVGTLCPDLTTFCFFGGAVATTTTAADGSYTFTGVMPGTRYVRFLAPGAEKPVWWPDARRYDKGDPITVAANANVTGVNIAL